MDYESSAFNHLAIGAFFWTLMEFVGFEPTSIKYKFYVESKKTPKKYLYAYRFLYLYAYFFYANVAAFSITSSIPPTR